VGVVFKMPKLQAVLNKINYNSPVILTYALISFAVWGLSVFTNGASNWHLFTFRPSSIFNPLMYLRMFTAILGHSNWNHYMNNFLFILLLGPAMEERYGSKTLLKMILVTAFITGVAYAFFGSGGLGASGIVFMLIILSSITNLKKGTIPFTLILALVIYIGQEVHTSVFSGVNSNIGHAAHIIGGLCGATMGLFISKYSE